MKKKSPRDKNYKNLSNAVIEIDEVEFLIDKKAARAINMGDKKVSLKRLIDGEDRIFSLDTINHSIKESGIIDRL